MAWADAAEQQAWINRAGEHSGWTPELGHLILERIRARGYVVGLGRELYQDLWHSLEAAGSAKPSIELAAMVDKLSANFGQESLEPDRSYEVGLMTAPVFGPEGVPVLQFSLLGLRSPMTGREVDDTAQRLLAATGAASIAAGGRVPLLVRAS